MNVMDWSGRQAWFERLLAMRDEYRTSEGRIGVLSIADAIRYGEAVMTAVELDVEPWATEVDEAVASEAPRSPLWLTRQRRFASDLWPWPSPSSGSPPAARDDPNPD